MSKKLQPTGFNADKYQLWASLNYPNAVRKYRKFKKIVKKLDMTIPDNKDEAYDVKANAIKMLAEYLQKYMPFILKSMRLMKHKKFAYSIENNSLFTNVNRNVSRFYLNLVAILKGIKIPVGFVSLKEYTEWNNISFAYNKTGKKDWDKWNRLIDSAKDKPYPTEEAHYVITIDNPDLDVEDPHMPMVGGKLPVPEKGLLHKKILNK